MPTYEYRCPEGHDFEKFVLKISDAQAELPCPSCGKVAARRVSAGGGLLFKGSGFYITDYGKDGKKDVRAAAKSDASKAKTDAGAASGGAGAGSASGAGASTSGSGSGSGGGSSGAASASNASSGGGSTSGPAQ